SKRPWRVSLEKASLLWTRCRVGGEPRMSLHIEAFLAVPESLPFQPFEQESCRGSDPTRGGDVGSVAKFEAEQVKLIECPRRQGAYRVGGHPLSPCSGYGPIRNPAGLVTMLHVGHRYLAEQGVLGIDHRPAVAASLLPIFFPGTQPTLRRIRGVDWL